MRKRVLFISRIRADGAGSGGQQRRQSILSALQRVAEVDQLILGYDPDATASDELYLPSLNRPRFLPASLLRLVDASLIRIAQGWSENSAWLSVADRRKLADRILSGRYDIVFANRALLASLVLSALGERSAAIRLHTDFDDIVSDAIMADLRVRGFVHGVQTGVARWIEAKLVRRIERRVARASAAIYVCSDDDRGRLAARFPGRHVVRLPNIAQVHTRTDPSHGERLDLLFVGSLDYQPNHDGVAWFLKEIWPAARARFGDAVTLTVVGRGTAALVRGWADIAGLTIHLNVQSLEPFYADATACIVPVRYGGGTSIKAIEAMAARRPLLSTSVGVRGLGLSQGRNYLEFADATGFIRACESLIARPELRRELVVAAYRCWEERFSQAAVDEIVAGMIG